MTSFCFVVTTSVPTSLESARIFLSFYGVGIYCTWVVIPFLFHLIVPISHENPFKLSIVYVLIKLIGAKILYGVRV